MDLRHWLALRPAHDDDPLFVSLSRRNAGARLSRAAIRTAAAHLMQNLPAWDPAKIDMAYWHFGTLAMFQVGGASWNAWNAKMKKAIVCRPELQDLLQKVDRTWGKLSERAHVTTTSMALSTM